VCWFVKNTSAQAPGLYRHQVDDEPVNAIESLIRLLQQDESDLADVLDAQIVGRNKIVQLASSDLLSRQLLTITNLRPTSTSTVFSTVESTLTTVQVSWLASERHELIKN